MFLLTFRFLILLYKFRSQKYNFNEFPLIKWPLSIEYYPKLAGVRNSVLMYLKLNFELLLKLCYCVKRLPGNFLNLSLNVRELPSQVKGDRFRAYSRRGSCVRIAPLALIFNNSYLCLIFTFYISFELRQGSAVTVQCLPVFLVHTPAKIEIKVLDIIFKDLYTKAKDHLNANPSHNHVICSFV